MNIIKNDRVEWVDITRGIGILLMVIGHAGNIPNIKIWIYSFHMPLFFILSGYIYGKYKSNKYTNSGLFGLFKLLKKNIKSYLVPYVFLFIVNFIIQSFFEFIKFGLEYFKNGGNTYRYLIKGLLYSYDTDYPNCDPLWFLTCLFITYIFLWIILELNTNVQRLICVCFYIITSILVVRVEIYYNLDELPWHIDVALVAAVFMYVGTLLVRYEEIIQKRVTRIILIGILFVGSVFGYINGKVNMVKNQYNSLALFLISSVFICFSLIFLIKMYSHKNGIVTRVVVFWGKNTLIFMGFNYFFNLVLRQVFARISMVDSIIYSFVDVIITMTGCTLIGLLFNNLKRKSKIFI